MGLNENDWENIPTKCKTCGMTLLPKSKVYGRVSKSKKNMTTWKPKIYCNKICQQMYAKYPNEFGLWWKE